MVRDGQTRAASFYSNRAPPPVILKVMQKHAEICFFLKEVPHVFCCLAFSLQLSSCLVKAPKITYFLS